VISRAGGGALNADTGEPELTAGWGHAGKGGVTMPGKGKANPRDYTSDEREALEAGAIALGLTLDQALRHLGETSFDVYPNDVAYWKNVPRRVWGYTIGGYQVIKGTLVIVGGGPIQNTGINQH
jgi:hypothetical protein